VLKKIRSIKMKKCDCCLKESREKLIILSDAYKSNDIKEVCEKCKDKAEKIVRKYIDRRDKLIKRETKEVCQFFINENKKSKAFSNRKELSVERIIDILIENDIWKDTPDSYEREYFYGQAKAIVEEYKKIRS
jgi:hypothetical protein